MTRKAYPSDVRDEAWALVASYLTPMMEDAPQREHSLREVFHGLRWSPFSGLFFSNLPQDSCWIPSDNSVGRHIFGHYTASANNGVLAHSNAT
jgi:hypothetical protein